ncbi:hypothetical protein ACQ0QQ_14025 [Lysinibacillus sphaericus]
MTRYEWIVSYNYCFEIIDLEIGESKLPVLNCEFFFASDPSDKSLVIPTSPIPYRFSIAEIGLFGNIYTGQLIRHLGRNYDSYSNNISGVPIWGIPSNFHSNGVGKVKIQSDKQRSTDIIGNIGETLIVPALANSLGLNIFTLPFQRIKAYRTKCPDYRIESNWPAMSIIWPLHFASYIGLPNDLPIEVKTTISTSSSNDYSYQSALKQLVSYWKECLNNGYDEAVGCGIIACVDLDSRKNPGSYNHNVRYYLFVRKEGFSLKRLEYILDVTSEKQKKIKKKLKKMIPQYIVNKWIGMQFL